MGFVDNLKNIFAPQQFLLKDQDGAEVVFSVLVREQITDAWDYTERPVEVGLPISDNRRAKPITITIDVLFVDDQPELSFTGITSMFDGIQTAADKGNALLAMLRSNATVTVSLSSGVYENYACTVHDRTVQANQNAWQATLTLRQIRAVATQLKPVSLSLAEQKALSLPDNPLKGDADKKANHVPQVKDNKKKPKGFGANETSAKINNLIGAL